MSTGSGNRVDSPHREDLDLPNLGPNDIIIAVMGITGCGKTTFVNFLADKQFKVGHGLDSCTSSVQVAYGKLEDGTKIYLVDTPGFDDTKRTDSQILVEIVLWLNKAHISNVKLAGIIYLHKISDTRLGGSGTKNLRMFQALCGEKSLGSVVLASTMWDVTAENISVQREKELKSNPDFWKEMIDHGSQVFRQNKGKESALEIVRYLIAKKRPVTLGIQVEMVDEKKDLVDTSAGSGLASEAESVVRRYEAKMMDLEKQLREARESNNKQVQELLEQTKEQYQEVLGKQRQEISNLQISSTQLLEQTKKQFEQYEQAQREMMKRVEENHKRDLVKQKKQIKQQLHRDLTGSLCTMM